MEIGGEDGSRIELDGESEAVFGRFNGFNTKDRTVSRQHVRFQLQQAGPQTEPTALFEVIGKNPIWVRRVGGEVGVFRKLERGEVAAGDWFCVSSGTPVWFKVEKKRIGSSGARMEVEGEGASEVSGDSENVDVSRLDPVKEFGFLVMGREFDCYPEQRIRDAKNWDWFLGESDGEDVGSESKRRKRERKKRRCGSNEDDEDWTDESKDDDQDIVTKTARIVGPEYLTRSKDRQNGRQGSSRKKGAGITRKVINHREEEEDDDEDDDETLRRVHCG